MKFLVLGANSFYGSTFVKMLRELDEPVIELSRPEWNLGHDIPHTECLVNFASRSLVAESWRDPMGWMVVNAALTTDLLERARTLGIKRFVHVSTPEVYGHTAQIVREGHPFNPSTPYAVSRAAADMMIAAYVKAYGFPAIITRTANIYGFFQPEHRFIPHVFKMLRAGHKVALDGGGTTVRGWLHVEDACAATYLLCREGYLGETYHIAPRGIRSTKQVASLICAQLGLDPKEWLTTRPDRLGKDQAYILDSSKTRALGWTDDISLEAGLAEYGNHLAVH